jgi:hypothetical protein
MLMKNSNKIVINLLFIAFTIACNPSNQEKEKTQIKGRQSPKTDTVAVTNRKSDIDGKIETKKDTIIIEKNEIISFNDKEIITTKGNRPFISKKSYRCGDNKYIILINIDSDDNFLPQCNDPICALIIVSEDGKIVKLISIPTIYDEDVKFLFKDKFNRYFFEHYSSPAGYTMYYIIDTNVDKIYKTEYFPENETFIKESFNFLTKTYQVKNIDNNKVTMKHLLLLKK